MDWERLNVIVIFFWGRSGSVFLHSLFDSHPQVLTFPATRLNAFHSRQWAEISRERSPEEMVRRFISYNPSLFDGREDRWFEGLDRMGPDKSLPLFVDTARFTEHALHLLEGDSPISRKRFFIAAHFAYALARGEDVSQKDTIVYHLHSPEAYPAIRAALEDFPSLKALGITREPIRSTLSYLRKNVLAARAWGQDDRSEYHQLARSDAYNAVYRHQLIGWRELVARHRLPFRSLRLEDLNRDTEAEMRGVAAFSGLDWHACLTQSTFNGLEYWGDQLSIGQTNGVSRRAPSAEESDAALDALDRYVLEGLLARFRREFGYGQTSRLQRWLTPLLVLMPTRLERLAFETARAGRGLAKARSSADYAPILRQMLARQGFSYRHLLTELMPGLRARLPLPAPLSPGLVLPPRGDAQATRASQTRVVYGTSTTSLP